MSESKRNIYTKRKVTILIMLAALLLVMIVGVASGSTYISPGEVLRVILGKWGILRGVDTQSPNEAIVYLVRFPRVVVACLVGAALAVSGAVLQGMFRNPMADPGILGVSSGAGLGAVIALALGLTAQSMYFLPLFASVGALVTVIIIYLLSVRDGKIPTLTLILSGIAVSTFIGAITNIVLTKMDEYQIKTFVFWTVGGLRDRVWEHAGMIALPVLICVLILMGFARDLNIMLLGEEEAQSVGLNPSRTRKLLLVFASITTALAVSVSGPIGFIGLIVPHMLRLITGPDYRILIPASAFGGAIFLVLCDIISRVLPSGEIGVGIVTALIGAPYFLYLLAKARKEGAAL